MPTLSVAHQTADRFQLQVRSHRLLCDQPLAEGGGDQGPTPTELFVGSLAACVAFYARRFLARHDLDPTGLRVDADFTMSTDRPARVASVTLRLIIPQPLVPNRRRALLAVVDHCTVHNSIRTPPHVHLTLTEPADAGVGAHRSLGLGG
jgi:putative redox protein